MNFNRINNFKHDINFWLSLLKRAEDGEDVKELCLKESIGLSTFKLYKKALSGEDIYTRGDTEYFRKVSENEQIEIINEYKKRNTTDKKFCEEFSVPLKLLKTLKIKYLLENQTIYSNEESIEHVKRWISSGLTKSEYSKNYGIESRTLTDWARRYKLSYTDNHPTSLSKSDNEIRKRKYEISVGLRILEREKGHTKANDLNLTYLKQMYPELKMWRFEAVNWIKNTEVGIPYKLSVISIFFEKYLMNEFVENDISKFFMIATKNPKLSVVLGESYSTKLNNTIVSFLYYVIQSRYPFVTRKTSSLSDYGLRNPFSRQRYKGIRPSESVRNRLPIGYIDDIKNLIIQGPNFSNWRFASTALSTEYTRRNNAPSADWFQVNKNTIDKKDPDCVWRIRVTESRGRTEIYEMWSPVRWVCLLVLLFIPIRKSQARLLDSGEADTWIYTNQGYKLNDLPFAKGSISKPYSNGIFRKMGDQFDEKEWTALYINTNKTADCMKSDNRLGYTMYWENRELLYWLEKLRNWQMKYNSISSPLKWTALDERHVIGAVKPKLLKYPDTCFLFRLPENDGIEKTFPLTKGVLYKPWYLTLKKLQNDLDEKKIFHADGSKIKFVPPFEKSNNCQTTYFPIHSLRVSLISALAYEGKVPFQILSRLVGHSRMIMTIYYAKPGNDYSRNVLENAEKLLNANKESSIVSFLRNAQTEVLVREIVSTSESNIKDILPSNPNDRNAAGWLMLHHGLCIAGGNSSPLNIKTYNGCHNGGPDGNLVPGGIRNCVRCKWFVTQPHFLNALVSHYNGIAYHLDESRNQCRETEKKLIELKRERLKCEQDNGVFLSNKKIIDMQRIWDKKIDEFCNLAESLGATYKIIEKCCKLLDKNTSNSALITNSSIENIQIILNETDSELLQISGLCQDMEIYDDLFDERAILRRSQILDKYLYSEKKKPKFYFLSINDQLKVGNSFIKSLSNNYKLNDRMSELEYNVNRIENRLKMSNLVTENDNIKE